MPDAIVPNSGSGFLGGGGEMGARMRAYDWAATPVGPPQDWPLTLKASVRLMLSSRHPMFIWWGEALTCFYNDAYSAAIGPDRHPSALGRPGREVWAEIWDIIGPDIDFVMAGRGATWHERQLVPISRGSTRVDVWWTYGYSPIDNEAAATGVGGVLVICRDVTAEMQAEQARIAEAERLRQLFEQAPGFMCMLRGPEHRFELANTAYLRLVGQRDILDKPVREALPEIEGQGFFELLDRVYATGEPFIGRGAKIAFQVNWAAEPEQRLVDFVYQPIVDGTGRVSGIFVEGSDVTERARAEARLARLLATTPAGIVELDADGCFAYANAAAERVFGTGPGGLVGRRFDDPAWQAADDDGAPIPPERLPGAWALRGEAMTDYEHAVTTSDGRRATILVDVVPVRDGAGRVEGALAAFQDVTARRAQAQALRESEARFRSFVENASDVLWIIDAGAQRLEYLSPSYERIWGEPRERVMQDLGRWAELVHPEDRTRAAVALPRALAGETCAIEYRIVRDDGAMRWILDTGFPIPGPDGRVWRVGGVAQDITKRKQAEAALLQLNETLEARVAERTAALSQAVDALHAEALERTQAEDALRQAQKMEAVGQLTGGIAHDFNNMLQAIDGALEMLWRRIEQGRAAEASRYVQAARGTVERAAALTNRLLAFARRQTLHPKPVELNKLIEGTAELIRRTMGPDVTVELRLGDGAWTVLCDPNQVENALLNLAINARDAMPGSGRLTICTGDVRLSEADVAKQEGAEPGDYVEIAVSDIGSGMDEATRTRAFEPFFTTKPIGQGTGLGLSQVYGFVRQSNGVVRLDSAPGRGTTVRLYLRRHGHAREAAADGAEGASPAAEVGTGGTVLLVEDEAGVREVAAERLRELGYAVLEAADGSEALRVLHGSRGASVDLLVTDVGLPGGLNGRQVADIMRDRHPGLPVLFITGYAGRALEEHLAPGMDVIGKPFTLDALAKRVRAMLA